MADIQLQVHVSSKPSQLFDLVAGASGLARWWSDDAHAGPEGMVQVTFLDGKHTLRMRPETMVLPVRVGWRVEKGREWQDTMIIFDIVPEDEGTCVRFSHAGWSAETDLFRECAAAWGALLHRLKHAAESGAPHPLFRGRQLDLA